MIDQLRQLVSRYVNRGIGFEPFRRELVSGFLTASDNDAAVRRLYRDVEIACVAREHNVITDTALKTELTKLIAPSVILTAQYADGIFEGVQQPPAVNSQAQWVRVKPTANVHINSISTSFGTWTFSPLVAPYDSEDERNVA